MTNTQDPNQPLPKDHPAVREFIALTRKRSARMATLAVLILIVTGYFNVVWWLQILAVLVAFIGFNVLSSPVVQPRGGRPGTPPAPRAGQPSSPSKRKGTP